MKRNFKMWVSLTPFQYMKYIPIIIFKLKNWFVFLINYIFDTKKAGIYFFRNGTTIKYFDGAATGTISVVFIKKNYGNIFDKNIIVEIGANIGIFSIYAANQNKNSFIYAFEPILENYEMLVENIKINKLNNRIKAFNFGIASKKEQREFFHVSSTLHSFINTEKADNKISIDCITLKDIFDINKIENIDLLKINCEGAEYEILYSTSDEFFGKIKEIRMEYHNLDKIKLNLNYLIEYFKKNGYKVNYLYEYSQDDGFLWVKRNDL